MQEKTIVCLLTEEVDKGVIALLIGDESGVIASFAESLHYAFGAVEDGIVFGISERKEYRHALVRGVALAHIVGEDGQSLRL